MGVGVSYIRTISLECHTEFYLFQTPYILRAVVLFPLFVLAAPFPFAQLEIQIDTTHELLFTNKIILLWYILSKLLSSSLLTIIASGHFSSMMIIKHCKTKMDSLPNLNLPACDNYFMGSLAAT